MRRCFFAALREKTGRRQSRRQLLVDEQAERVALRIEHHPHVVLRLMVRHERTLTDRPLDPGMIYGPEQWRVIDGVEFSHWDRWLLRLAISEPNGLDSIEATFLDRRNNRRSHDDAEAMLSQLSDLRRRLAQFDRSAGGVLDAEEIASEWLFNKAWKRVWHSGAHRKTRAMTETPCWRFERRALRGHWSAFPVSPATFERELSSMVGGEMPAGAASLSA